jgi:hypothetical protein
MRVLSLVALGLLLFFFLGLGGSGCYSPKLEECKVRCGVGAICPESTTCGEDGYCHVDPTGHCMGDGGDLEGGAGDGSALDGAAEPDGPEADGPRDFDLTVTFAGVGTGNVLALSGMTTVGTFTMSASLRLAAGAYRLTATPSTGSRFESWMGCTAVNADQSCSVTLDAPKTVIVTFQR